MTLTEALELTRTGDVWLFRGHSVADRAIRVTTNSPVNHVGMSVVIDDLPPLMWHAALGRSLPDMWSGVHQRGVQLNDLRRTVEVWANRYGQQAWLRQLHHPVTREATDAVLRTIARLDGTPFPSTAQLASRWLLGRIPSRKSRRNKSGNTDGGTGGLGAGRKRRKGTVETAYCAEVVAVTYEAMGLLLRVHHPNWYDPGRFWSGDELELTGGSILGGEIAVDVGNTNDRAPEPAAPASVQGGLA
jgi:hypothetical protein